jgi:hypothetical protein
MPRAHRSSLKAGLLLGIASLFLGGSNCGQTKLATVLPADAQVDTFTQAAIPQVDILWVVDNSPSMVTKQQELVKNFQTFFSALQSAGVDYHLALASTDVTPAAAGQLINAPGQPAVITTSTPDGAAAFEANVGAIGTGSGYPEGLNAARDVLMFDPPDFIRPTAYLFLIFVSDSDDNSEPGDPLYFYRYFAGFKGKGNNAMVLAGSIAGIVNGQAAGCFAPPDIEAIAATRYLALMQMMNGQTGSICDADFTQTLVSLGVEAVGLQRTFNLSELPDPTTIEVKISYPCGTATDLLNTVCSGSQTSTCTHGGPTTESISCTMKQDTTSNGTGNGWVYQSSTNSIVFDGEGVPPKGAVIEIIYYQPGKKPH